MSAKSRMFRKNVKYFFLALIGVGIIQFMGLHTHLFERDFDSEFEYPLVENLYPYVEQLRNNDKPSVEPINFYNYTFKTDCQNKCKYENGVRLLIMIKSAVPNVERRMAIRSSWGYERRFSDVTIKRVFILGRTDNDKLQVTIDKESKDNEDIVQADFQDSYFNNTIKTMMGFTWAMKYCNKAKFFMFSDDDMYISIKNVLRFTRNPSHYPEYVEEALEAMKRLNLENHLKKKGLLNQSVDKKILPGGDKQLLSAMQNEDLTDTRIKRQIQLDYDLPDDAILFTGFVFNSSPHRHKTSKWYVSLDEYPWHRWPPYVSAGAYILSREAFINMYYASFFTKHFRFDDIYLGILAKKMGIVPFHCKEFYFYKKNYNNNYHFVVASHGYGDPDELLRVWNEQRASGNA